jgi:hypothetical protein
MNVMYALRDEVMHMMHVMHVCMQRMIGLFGIGPPFKGNVFLETSAGCICFCVDANKVDFDFSCNCQRGLDYQLVERI